MRALPLAVALLILLPGLALAQPPGTSLVGDVEVRLDLADEEGRRGPFVPGTTLEVTASLTNLGNRTYLVTVSANEGRANATLAPVDRNTTDPVVIVRPTDVSFTVVAPDAPGPHSLDVAVLVDERNGTNTTRVASAVFALAFEVAAPPPPVAPLVPTWAWFALGAVVVLGGAYVVQRARKRQVRVAPRSRTLQELQVEQKAEKARPRQAAEVEAERQAVEAREAERLAQRETSIQDAKRNDILRSVELLKQRRERGEITQYQFDQLKAKKDAQLAELDRESGR